MLNIRRMANSSRNNQRGFTLIVIVGLIWILMLISLSEPLAMTTIAIADRENAQRVADGLAVPMRSVLDDTIYPRIEADLLEHLRKESAAKASGQTYVCQGVVSPGESLTDHEPICDPIAITKNLPSAKDQTLDLVTPLKKLTDPGLLKTDDWQSVERQLLNTYEYKMKGTFVSQEVLQAVSYSPGSPAIPRVDRFRWLVRAEAELYMQLNSTCPGR
jgi:hypothetical protein